MEREPLDRIETNLRLSLINQQEQSVLLKEVASTLRDLATKIDTVADKSDKTAERLEDSVEVMKCGNQNQHGKKRREKSVPRAPPRRLRETCNHI